MQQPLSACFCLLNSNGFSQAQSLQGKVRGFLSSLCLLQCYLSKACKKSLICLNMVVQCWWFPPKGHPSALEFSHTERTPKPACSIDCMWCALLKPHCLQIHWLGAFRLLPTAIERTHGLFKTWWMLSGWRLGMQSRNGKSRQSNFGSSWNSMIFNDIYIYIIINFRSSLLTSPESLLMSSVVRAISCEERERESRTRPKDQRILGADWPANIQCGCNLSQEDHLTKVLLALMEGCCVCLHGWGQCFNLGLTGTSYYRNTKLV